MPFVRNPRFRRYNAQLEEFDIQNLSSEEIKNLPAEVRRKYDIDFDLELSKQEFELATEAVRDVLISYDDMKLSPGDFVSKLRDKYADLDESHQTVVRALRNKNDRDHGEGWINKSMYDEIDAF